MILQDLLYKVSIRSIKGNTNIEVKDLVIDSRKVKPGSCFIALKGTKTDGGSFIESAVENGAVAIVCETIPTNLKENITYVQVESVAEAAGYLSHNYYSEPSLKLKLVGVTGTNGKTTIATLLWKLFTAIGYKCGLISTVQNQIAEQVIAATHTTPDAVNVNALLKQMADADCEFVFMECSSHAIHQGRISGFMRKKSFAGQSSIEGGIDGTVGQEADEAGLVYAIYIFKIPPGQDPGSHLADHPHQAVEGSSASRIKSIVHAASTGEPECARPSNRRRATSTSSLVVWSTAAPPLPGSFGLVRPWRKMVQASRLERPPMG